MNIGIIGGGISGLTSARVLMNMGHSVTVFERENRPGGLIKCDRVNGSLFHTCGGHIFNSKRADVLQWFWKIFQRNKEFTLADRNSTVCLNADNYIPYPIENHIYLLEEESQKKIVTDLLRISATRHKQSVDNFAEFLKTQFGETLYALYFEPYNEKVWRRNLSTVPLSWLEGKLPMPSVEEIILNNINHTKEKSFVHSTFWYERLNGSQYLADKLAKGTHIVYNTEISEIIHKGERWMINGMDFDKVVFCGNIKQLPFLLPCENKLSAYTQQIEHLEYHGTTSVFCQIDENPYSWIYLPNKEYEAHRIICTGNFSPTNNANGIMTGTVEFTDGISESKIKRELTKLPLHPRYLTHKFNKYTYPIQNTGTRLMIQHLKSELSAKGFYITGRFADWEYYNMDVAMGAAIDICTSLNTCWLN